MQEFHPVPGLAGRLFGGEAAAAAVAPEEVRCPRCDSANTKFCYYNNYNLSQPRHFCKACRRYWTKGGLLRNVPVGGGCRKPKRPAPSSSSFSSVADVDWGGHGHRDAKSARSASGGGDSSTASASATTPAVAPASNASSAAAATQPSSAGATANSSVAACAAADVALSLPPPPVPMFADQAAAFASLFGPPPPSQQPLPAFTRFSAQPKAEEDVAPALTPTDQSSPASFTADMAGPFAARSSGGPAATADWAPPTALDAGMFDLAGTITSYWNPASWTDHDETIYLP